MKNDRLLNIIGEIDDKYIADAAPQANRQRKTVWMKYGVIAACLAAFIMAIAAPMVFNRTPIDTPNPPANTEGWGNSEFNAVIDVPDPPVFNAGGTNGKINTKAECVIVKTENSLTNEEGYSYLENHLVSIKNDLSASGVKLENGLRISAGGYSHMRTGDSGNEMAVNARDYLLYSGDKLVSIATVIKESGNISYGLMFGAEWFDNYNSILKKYAGKELVYIYAGDVEVILTPDHKVLSTMGIDLSDVIDADEADSYYNYFKQAQNTYIPE